MANPWDFIVVQPSWEMQVIKKDSFTQYEKLPSEEMGGVMKANTKK